MKYEIRDGLTLPVWETFDAAKTLAELQRLYDNGRAFADHVASIASPTFAAIKEVRARDDFTTLTAEQQRIVLKAIESFTLAGADLPKKEQDELRDINQELASLATTFANNVTTSTDAWSLHVPMKACRRLEGIPEAVQSAMHNAAKKKGLDGAIITLGISH